MTRLLACALVLWSAGGAAAAAEVRYPVTGIVLDVRPESRTFVASIDAIPEFMPAMSMPFTVRDVSDLRSVARGMSIAFTLVVTDTESYAEAIRVRSGASLEQDPLAARRLALIQELTLGRAPAIVPPGGIVPHFSLIDHKFQPVTLSQFRGKVVVVNFTYTTCQLPDFCLRMVSHLGALKRRFEAQLGPDLVFLTITFDPLRDQPDVLDRYSAQWDPDPSSWHFLTGPLADVRPVLESFGVAAFTNDGLMDHGLQTAVIDRAGRLVVNLEGNQYSTDQLGDLIASELAAVAPVR